MAKTTAGKTGKAAKGGRGKKIAPPMTDDGRHPMYEQTAPRDAYKKNDIIFFPKVRDWLNKGTLVGAYGKVVNLGLFDNEVPYIEVSFDNADCKKLNKADLGKDIRKFLLEVK